MVKRVLVVAVALVFHCVSDSEADSPLVRLTEPPATHEGSFIYRAIAVAPDGSSVVATVRNLNLETGTPDGLWNIYRFSTDGEFIDPLTTLHDSGSLASAASIDPAFTPGGAAGFSDDGRWVAYSWPVDGLVPEDNNGAIDIFVHDVVSDDRLLVSRARDGGISNGNSQIRGFRGRTLVFSTDASNIGAESAPPGAVYHWTLDDRTARQFAIGNGVVADDAHWIRLNQGGRWVAYITQASLVPEDPPETRDIYLEDLETGEIFWVTEDLHAIESCNFGSGLIFPFAPSIDPSGRFVAFQQKCDIGRSDDPDHTFLFNRNEGSLRHLTVKPGGEEATIGDGRAFYDFLEPLDPFDPSGRYLLINGSAEVFGEEQSRTLMFWDLEEEIFLPALVDHKGDVSSEGFVNFGAVADDLRLVFYSRENNYSFGDGDGTGRLFVSDFQEGTVFNPIWNAMPFDAGERAPHFLGLSRDGSTLVFASSSTALNPARHDPQSEPPFNLFAFHINEGKQPIRPEASGQNSSGLAGFRFQALFSPINGISVLGQVEEDCIPDTVCLSGAVPGRPELLVRLPGPRGNGLLWPTVAKLSTSQVDLWIDQDGTEDSRYYRLGGAYPGYDVLEAMVDRFGFSPATTSVSPLRHETTALDDPPATAFESPVFPDFRFRVRLTNSAGQVQDVRLEDDCLAETLCFSGAIPGRSEAFVRVAGPKPNGFLWPTLARLTTSRVEIWIERPSTGETRYYDLPAATPGEDSLSGLFDRLGFGSP